MSRSNRTTSSCRAVGNFWKVRVEVSGDHHVDMSDIIAAINTLFNRHSPTRVFSSAQ